MGVFTLYIHETVVRVKKRESQVPVCMFFTRTFITRRNYSVNSLLAKVTYLVNELTNGNFIVMVCVYF